MNIACRTTSVLLTGGGKPREVLWGCSSEIVGRDGQEVTELGGALDFLAAELPGLLQMGLWVVLGI